MPRQIYLSFLGTTNYSKCTYYTADGSVQDVRFVQEASIGLKADSCDAYIFFLTKQAKTKNWADNGHKTRDGDVIKQDGLRSRLDQMKLKGTIQAVENIPLGVTEEEIWEIFHLVYDQLEKGDIIYFDITHALRSIPMLVLSLIHYAKFLKEIRIGGIYYGVFEPDNDIKRFPILDLTAFSDLQDWTTGASAFIQFGNADRLASLMIQSGDTERGEALLNVCQNISAVRFLEIYEGENATFLVKSLKSADKLGPVPLQPILREVESKINGFQANEILNGLTAVQWCRQHNLIQQGLTLLFEFVQTYVLVELGEKDWKTEKKRGLVSWALSKSKIDPIQQRYENGNLADELYHLAIGIFQLPYKKQLTEIYNNLGSGTRHDMNHAGIRENPKDSKALKASLDKNFIAVLETLNIPFDHAPQP